MSIHSSNLHQNSTKFKPSSEPEWSSLQQPSKQPNKFNSNTNQASWDRHQVSMAIHSSEHEVIHANTIIIKRAWIPKFKQESSTTLASVPNKCNKQQIKWACHSSPIASKPIKWNSSKHSIYDKRAWFQVSKFRWRNIFSGYTFFTVWSSPAMKTWCTSAKKLDKNIGGKGRSLWLPQIFSLFFIHKKIEYSLQINRWEIVFSR